MNVVSSYEEALQFCNERDSRLAILKVQAIRRFVRHGLIAAANVRAFIGLNRSTGNWLWNDGDPDIRRSSKCSILLAV